MSKRSKYLKNIKKAVRRKKRQPRFLRKGRKAKPSRTYYLKPAKKRKKILLGCLAATVFCGLIYFFGYSPVFAIKEIVIERQENIYSDISNEDLKGFLEPFLHTRRFLVFPQNNVLFFNGKITEKIIRKNLIVENFKIYRGINRIKIKIEEKLPVAVLVNGGNHYYLGLDGLVLRKVLESKMDKSLPIIQDKMAKPVELLEERLDGRTAAFIADFFAAFRQKFGEETKITFFEISDLENSDMTAEVSEGWKIYLDKTGSAAEQIENLKLVLDEEVKEERPNLEYVDLRLGKRVFYKLKEIAN